MPAPTTIVCFGETLWDVLPSSRQPGGAPCNVALHLLQLGQSAQLISRVGDEELGHELLTFLVARGLDPELVQLSHSHLTGMVKANVNTNGQQVNYRIVQPLAWDYIQFTQKLRTVTSQANIMVYGSLAARSQVSRETLYRLLQYASFKVFDLNLRPPHYSREVVKYLLKQADLVKLNERELTEVMQWLGHPATPHSALPWLAQQFNLRAICLTKGAAGASLYIDGAWWHSAGFPVTVADPVGCGDAFLAAFLASWVAGQPPAQCLRRACAAGAVVASRHGATPTLTEMDLHAILEKG
ncbi:carbohydrate kinase family protein [Hymenobacter terrenus]|uniref:carbohydrate kinase family protein n=1 Tax=Hymenobacter terrenus TaxID=1629124 RepID=UPI000619878F|nr:carbohydrate kinase [Hymenobacter terrenus]